MIVDPSEKLISKGLKCPYCGATYGINRIQSYIINKKIFTQTNVKVTICNCNNCKQTWKI